MDTIFWVSIASGIVLAHVLGWTDKTYPPDVFFGHGLLAHVEIRSDVDAIQSWATSLNPNDCRPIPHSGNPRGRYLRRERYPDVLRHHSGFVQLGLDAEGKPCVRLEWFQSKAGKFGLVIGSEDMETPRSEPGTYGEKRTELRPGIYFWYEEA